MFLLSKRTHLGLYMYITGSQSHVHLSDELERLVTCGMPISILLLDAFLKESLNTLIIIVIPNITLSD